MKNHIAVNISTRTLYMAKFWFLRYGSKYSQPIKLQVSLSLIKLTFSMEISINILIKLILSFLVDVVNRSVST